MGFRHSIFSYGSNTSHIPAPEEDPHFNEMSDEELRLLFEKVVSKNKILNLENEIFERYLARRNPKCLKAMAQVLESAKRSRKTTSHLVPISSVINLGGNTSFNREKLESISFSSLLSESRRITVTLPPKGYKITLNHRMEMVKKEIGEMEKSLKEMEKAYIKKRAHLKARLEEVELRILETAEIKKEFQEKIVESHLTGKIPAEKFIRFVERQLKATDNMIDKLRLKTSNVKIQIKKLKQEFEIRRELSESLRPIEFEQLSIENEIYQRDFEEKRKHYLEMKKVFGRFNLMVTNHKQTLSDKQGALKKIRRDIENNNTKIEKLKEEKKIREAEIQKTLQQNKTFLQLMNEYQIPDLLNF